MKYTNPDANEAYINSLENTGAANNKILAVLEMAIKNEAVTPAMYDKLKKIYVADHKSDAGYEAYVESLKPQS